MGVCAIMDGVKVYTMAELTDIMNRTAQSIYGVLKKEPFRTMLKNKKHKHKRPEDGLLVYSEEVKRELLKYYYDDADYNPQNTNTEKKETIAEGVGVDKKIEETPDNPQTNPPPAKDEPQEQETSITELKRQLEQLNKQLEVEKDRAEKLQQELTDKEAERRYLLTENGKLTALLAAEKAEKQTFMRLLPAAKPSFGQRVRALFSHNKEQKEAADND